MNNKKDSYSHGVGIFSWFGYIMSMPKRLELIKENNFDSTSIWWEDEIGDIFIKKEEMPKLVRDNGLILENIHVPYEGCNDLWSTSLIIREKALYRHLKWIEDCNKFEMPIMVMHVTQGQVSYEPNKYGMKSLMELVKKAEEAKVTIAIENTRAPKFLDFIFNNIESKYLGLCYDTSHDWLYSKDKALLLKKWGSILVAIHLSDNDGTQDRHWLPYKGNINWEEVTNNFPYDTYNGFITLETISTRIGNESDPKSFLNEAYKRVCKIRKSIESQ